MSQRHYSERIHYCTRCGASFRHTTEEGIQFACSQCNTWPMRHAIVSWREAVPEPDPLETLLIDSESA